MERRISHSIVLSYAEIAKPRECTQSSKPAARRGQCITHSGIINYSLPRPIKSRLASSPLLLGACALRATGVNILPRAFHTFPELQRSMTYNTCMRYRRCGLFCGLFSWFRAEFVVLRLEAIEFNIWILQLYYCMIESSLSTLWNMIPANENVFRSIRDPNTFEFNSLRLNIIFVLKLIILVVKCHICRVQVISIGSY